LSSTSSRIARRGAITVTITVAFTLLPLVASAQVFDAAAVAGQTAMSQPASNQAAAPQSLDAQPDNSSEASLSLPDAPGADRASSGAGAASSASLTSLVMDQSAARSPGSATLPEASRTEKYIEPGQPAPSLTAGDKALLGVKDAFSLLAAAGWLASAGYEQASNGSPNYGTDRGAFGQRLGAAVVLNSTEDVLGDAVLSPILREDPRYYRMGPGHNFFARLVYSGTRAIITRTDGGRTSPNFALLAGNLAGSALTNTYYPQLNRGPSQTMMTFGESLGGTAIGDVVREFYEDVEQILHLKHK